MAWNSQYESSGNPPRTWDLLVKWAGPILFPMFDGELRMGLEAYHVRMGPQCPWGSLVPHHFFPSLAPFPQVSKVSSWPWWASIIHICSVCRLLSNSCSVFEKISRRRCCRGESLKSSIVTYQWRFSRWHVVRCFCWGGSAWAGNINAEATGALIGRFFYKKIWNS